LAQISETPGLASHGEVFPLFEYMVGFLWNST